MENINKPECAGKGKTCFEGMGISRPEDWMMKVIDSGSEYAEEHPDSFACFMFNFLEDMYPEVAQQLEYHPYIFKSMRKAMVQVAKLFTVVGYCKGLSVGEERFAKKIEGLPYVVKQAICR